MGFKALLARSIYGITPFIIIHAYNLLPWIRDFFYYFFYSTILMIQFFIELTLDLHKF